MKKSSDKRGMRAQYTSVLVIILISISGSLVLNVDRGMMIANVLIGLFVWGKMTLAMMFTQGWKVFNRKTVLGIPRLLFTFYVILGTILVLMALTNMNMAEFPSAQINIYSFLITASGALISTLVAWYCGINDWMAKGSEYDARVQFLAKGYSQDVVEEKISQLKEHDLIPS